MIRIPGEFLELLGVSKKIVFVIKFPNNSGLVQIPRCFLNVIGEIFIIFLNSLEK